MSIYFNPAKYQNAFSYGSSAKNNNFSLSSTKTNSQKSNYTVFLKTDDMLYSGGNASGLSFYVKYAENSTAENPIAIAKGVDENGNDFEQTINLNDVNPKNASVVEMQALGAHLKADKGGFLSSLPFETSEMGLNDKNNFLNMYENSIQNMKKLHESDLALRYVKNHDLFSEFLSTNK